MFLTLSPPLEGSCDVSKVVSRILIVFINHCSMLHQICIKYYSVIQSPLSSESELTHTMCILFSKDQSCSGGVHSCGVYSHIYRDCFPLDNIALFKRPVFLSLGGCASCLQKKQQQRAK